MALHNDTRRIRRALQERIGEAAKGYRTLPTVRGPWGTPEVMTETTIASGEKDDFEPTGDSGVEATNLGMFAWFVYNLNNQVLFFQDSNTSQSFYRSRTRESNGWGSFGKFFDGSFFQIDNPNRTRDPLPYPAFIFNRSMNIEGLYDTQAISGILIDDATGQSFYYCNSLLTQPRCEHYRRAITDAPKRELEDLYPGMISRCEGSATCPRLAVSFGDVQQRTVTLSGGGTTVESGVMQVTAIVPRTFPTSPPAEEAYRIIGSVTASVTAAEFIAVGSSTLSLGDPPGVESKVQITGQPTVGPLYTDEKEIYLPVDIPYRATTDEA